MTDLAALTLETFEPLVGSAFAVSAEEAAGSPAVRMTLARAESLGGAGMPGGRVPFRLVFHGPLSPVLPQQIYYFRRGEDDWLGIFVVPIGPADGHMGYEAIFT